MSLSNSQNGINESDLAERLGVDLGVLEAFMDASDLGNGPLTDFELLVGGTQNILVKYNRAGRSFVLRRPPLHLRASSNEVLRREARVLAALSNSDVPHPRLIASCDEELMAGAVFYLMEPVCGFNPAMGLPEIYKESADYRHRMGIEAVSAIAKLAKVDYNLAGLSDFGSPENFVDRQPDRWISELESYSKLENYPGPEISNLPKVAKWLQENKPGKTVFGIMHGDFHLANMLFDYNSPRLLAAVDWEMSTVGDPLLDLGWLIATWPSEGGIKYGPAMALTSVDGFCTPDELIAAYGSMTGFDLTYINWYVVLACFKLGIILEGTYARAFAKKADRSVGELLHTITLELFNLAEKYL